MGETLSPGTARCPKARQMPMAVGKRAITGETAIAHKKMVICRENVLPSKRAAMKRKKKRPQ
jgi:hypothetical protein